MAKGKITAVIEVDEYAACLSCTGIVTSINNVAGQCNVHKLKLGKCRKSFHTKFVVEGEAGKTWHLIAFEDQLMTITAGQECQDISKKSLTALELKV